MRVLERLPGRFAWAFVLVATVRIVAVYPVYNHTIDEPAHLACGLEWLSRGQYKYEPQHPPLTRVMAALLPFLDGSRTVGRPGIYSEGAAILYQDNRYDRKLALARAGILPFFWVACACLFLGARRAFGGGVAALAVLLFSATPAVLAHAALATTDMGLTAGYCAALFAFLWWLENPSWSSAAMLGGALALAVGTKLSSLVFLPATFMALAAFSYRELRFRKQWLLTLPLTAAVALLLGWAFYRFSFGPTSLGLSLPAPEFFAGIQDVLLHQQQGHPSYLLGQLTPTGSWLFYPVVLGVKTPLALLALALYGLWLCAAKKELAAKSALAVVTGLLAVGLFSNINIGARHILPIYIALSLSGAFALWHLTMSPGSRPWLGWAASALLLLHLGAGALAHPDYLPYTNILAGGQPELILADSDLDWGQDMKRLGQRLREVNAPSVAFAPFISAHLEAVHGFPKITSSHPQLPSPGWNAVSLTVLKVARMGLYFSNPGVQLWPEMVPPQERIGKGVLLYYFPPDKIRQLPPE